MANRTTTANSASLVVATNPALLYGLTAYNAKASDQFLQVHDASALPADGAVPKITLKVAAASNISLDYDARGRYFTNGIVVALSSTQQTLTISTADLWIDAQVEGDI